MKVLEKLIPTRQAEKEKGMKQDIDLMRQILLKVEENQNTDPSGEIVIPGFDKKTIVWHCKILYENGLISAYDVLPADEDMYYLFRVGDLTIDGYNLLDRIRSEKDWKKFKKKITKRKLPAIIETVKNLLLDTVTAVAEGITKGLKG